MYKRVRDLKIFKTLIIPMFFLMSFFGFILNVNNDSIFNKTNDDVILINTGTSLSNIFTEVSNGNKTEEFVNVQPYLDVLKNLKVTKQTSKIDVLRDEISKKYDINIFYQDELSDYDPIEEYKIIKLYNEDIIYKKLNEINDILSKFPDGFFNESSKFHMNIYLIESFDNSNYAGLTESNYASSKATITITNTVSTYNVLYHELMHYIQFYIIYKNKIDPFIEIEKYNPPDFKYGEKNEKYIYKTGSDVNTKYFIDSYSQTLYYEDIATIFESLMLYESKPEYYKVDSPIYKKANFINELIRKNYNSLNTTNRWERFIR